MPCRIRRLSFFGSVLREDFGTESDVDVLVEFAPDAGVGLFEFVDLQRELGERRGRSDAPPLAGLASSGLRRA